AKPNLRTLKFLRVVVPVSPNLCQLGMLEQGAIQEIPDRLIGQWHVTLHIPEKVPSIPPFTLKRRLLLDLLCVLPALFGLPLGTAIGAFPIYSRLLLLLCLGFEISQQLIQVRVAGLFLCGNICRLSRFGGGGMFHIGNISGNGFCSSGWIAFN